MKSLISVVFKNEKRRDTNSKDGVKGRIFGILSFTIVFGALAGFMAWASVYITKKLEAINQPYAFINIMLLGNFLILFIESIFQTLNSIYFSKDLKILLRMPIKSRDIIHSKLLKLITSEYQMEIIMLAIPMIVYGIIYQVSFTFYLYVTIILLILPIIPISITASIVAIIMRFTNLIKNKSKVMYVTILIAILALNILLSLFGGQASIVNLFSKEVLETENGLGNEISNSFKLIVPIMDSLQNYNTLNGIKSLGLYVLESIVIYTISILIISPIYLKGVIGTVINGNKKAKKEKAEITIKDFKKNSYKKAYIYKEFKVIKRSPIFFIQCIIMPVALSISILFIFIAFMSATKNIGIDILYQIRKLSRFSWIAGGFLAVNQIMYMLNFASIIAVSKEERASIITKYIPIKLSRQLNLKLLIGKIINFISSIVIVSLYYICTNNIIYSVFLLIISIGLNSLGEKIKILIDLKNPRIKWDSEYAMMKQNTNVMYELFYTMIVILISILAGFIITNINIYFSIMILAILIINIRLNKYIFKNDTKIFENIF